jgi:hypothetical protein
MLGRGLPELVTTLSNVTRDRESRPPDSSGVYVVAERPWREMPTKTSGIIYVGQARYLRRRIGELLCDLLGFTGDDYSDSEAYEHRGGQILWHYYRIAHAVEPSSLYLCFHKHFLRSAAALLILKGV